MFFIFFGTREKFLGKKRISVHFRGKTQQADVSVSQNYIHLFWIPVIPLGKTYSIYLLEDGELYVKDFFNKIPEELLQQCRDQTREF